MEGIIRCSLLPIKVQVKHIENLNSRQNNLALDGFGMMIELCMIQMPMIRPETLDYLQFQVQEDSRIETFDNNLDHTNQKPIPTHCQPYPLLRKY